MAGPEHLCRTRSATRTSPIIYMKYLQRSSRVVCASAPRRGTSTTRIFENGDHLKRIRRAERLRWGGGDHQGKRTTYLNTDGLFCSHWIGCNSCKWNAIRVFNQRSPESPDCLGIFGQHYWYICICRADERESQTWRMCLKCQPGPQLA